MNNFSELARMTGGATELDPRALGFNYGRPLGVPKLVASDKPAWEDNQMAREYAELTAYTRALASIGTKINTLAWGLEMALRDVRNACSPAEQAAAMQKLRATFHAVDAATEQLKTDKIKLHRFGRVGNVLRSWTSCHNR